MGRMKTIFWNRSLLRTLHTTRPSTGARRFMQCTVIRQQEVEDHVQLDRGVHSLGQDQSVTSTAKDNSKQHQHGEAHVHAAKEHPTLVRRVVAPISSTVKNAAVIRDLDKLRAWRRQMQSQNAVVGLVPTMGALHQGHLSLIEEAAKKCDKVVVSIFVNPTQFGPTEDLSSYPQTWVEDVAKIKALNETLWKRGSRGVISAIFAPSVATMYPGVALPLPSNGLSYVNVSPSLTGILEGSARPTFFRGVATVVMKLFWMVQPDQAYFGQKDVQQVAVLNRMRQDFSIPVQIRIVPIQRDENKLALSSRNAYLGARRAKVAGVLYRALSAALDVLRTGEIKRKPILDAALAVAAEELDRQRSLPPAERALFEVDYISLANMASMREIDDVQTCNRVVLSATFIMLPLEEPDAEKEVLGVGGDTKPVRLLDNMVWRSRGRTSSTTEAGDGP